jgi:hypothetical protein
VWQVVIMQVSNSAKHYMLIMCDTDREVCSDAMHATTLIVVSKELDCDI